MEPWGRGEGWQDGAGLIVAHGAMRAHRSQRGSHQIPHGAKGEPLPGGRRQWLEVEELCSRTFFGFSMGIARWGGVYALELTDLYHTRRL